VKSNASILGKIKECKYSPSSTSNADIGFFCEVGFLGPLSPNDVMLNFPKNHVF
jgi:hypothetical protein